MLIKKALFWADKKNVGSKFGQNIKALAGSHLKVEKVTREERPLSKTAHLRLPELNHMLTYCLC